MDKQLSNKTRLIRFAYLTTWQISCPRPFPKNKKTHKQENPGGNQAGDKVLPCCGQGKGKGQMFLWQTTPSVTIGEWLLRFKYSTLSASEWVWRSPPADSAESSSPLPPPACGCHPQQLHQPFWAQYWAKGHRWAGWCNPLNWKSNG